MSGARTSWNRPRSGALLGRAAPAGVRLARQFSGIQLRDVATNTKAGGSGTALAATVPSTAQVGDLLVALVTQNIANVLGAGPAGWFVAVSWNQPGSSNSITARLHYKIAEADDIGASASFAGAGGLQAMTLAIGVFYDVNGGAWDIAPLDAADITADGGSGFSIDTAGALATAAANELIIACAAMGAPSGCVFTPPDTATEVSDLTAGAGAGTLAWMTQADAAPIPVMTFGMSASFDSAVTLVASFRLADLSVQNITLPALTITPALPAPTVVPGAAAITLPALAIPPAFPAPAVASVASVALPALTVAPQLPALSVAASNAITLPALAVAPQFPQPTITPGAVGVTLPAIVVAPALPGPTITPGAANVALPALAITPVFPAPEVASSAMVGLPALSIAPIFPALALTASAAIALPALSVPPSFPGLALAPGSVDVGLPPLSVSIELSGLAVASGGALVEVGPLTVAPVFPALVVSAGAVDIALPSLTISLGFPGVAAHPEQTVTLGALTITPQFPAPSVASGAVAIALPALAIAPAFPSLGLAAHVDVTLPPLSVPPSFPGMLVACSADITLPGLAISLGFPALFVTGSDAIVALPALTIIPVLPALDVALWRAGRVRALGVLRANEDGRAASVAGAGALSVESLSAETQLSGTFGRLALAGAPRGEVEP